MIVVNDQDLETLLKEIVQTLDGLVKTVEGLTRLVELDDNRIARLHQRVRRVEGDVNLLLAGRSEEED